MNVLVDTSVWSEAFRKTSGYANDAIVEELRELMEEQRVVLIGPVTKSRKDMLKWYLDTVKGDDRWALVDYVKSLEVAHKPAPPPGDPILAGRAVIDRRGCRGCHVLDDGKGGNAGPDLRLSAQKLSPDWVRGFLRAPREAGKIYFWRPQRMPDLHLGADEVETLALYLLAVGKRTDRPQALPDPASFAAAKVQEGNLLFMLRCTECHQLGKVVETPLIKQQGPDLINVAGRVDYSWAGRWILDPKKIDPATKMTVPGLTKDQVDAVRMFIWKASMEEAAKKGKLSANMPQGR